MIKRKICIVTGSRAEYGLLYWIIKSVNELSELELQLVVTGMHLSPEFGLTYKFIEADGFPITQKVDMLTTSDSAMGIAKSIGRGTSALGQVFEDLKPDLILILGDRFELLAVASAALVSRIPVGHIHGGEITEGAFDEAIRHAITKMAHLHFASTEVYRKRIIQLGENPRHVFNVGAPGIDNIRCLDLLDRPSLEKELGIDLGERSLLVTWHPVTWEPGQTEFQFQCLLEVLKKLDDIKLIFTKANADNEGRQINTMIDSFVGANAGRAVVFASLGQVRYLSTLKLVSGVIGNSSSGIIEAPSVGTGTVNIGSRQGGRIQASSVIDCEPSLEAIEMAIDKLFDPEFMQSVKNVSNPYDQGGASKKIVDVLHSCPLGGILKKKFFDISFTEGNR